MVSDDAVKEEISYSLLGRINSLLCSDEAGREILVEALQDEQVWCGKRSGWWMQMQTRRRVKLGCRGKQDRLL